MDIYSGFAPVYDQFMADVPYDAWADYVVGLWNKYKLAPELILDLACGTGNMTERLAKRGYDMIGVDISQDMLSIALEKAKKENQDILYLCQDMRNFELYGTVDACLCLCDGINYITEIGDLLKVFKLVKNYLNPGGLFLFDMNTAYKYAQILGDNVFGETMDDKAYIWENYYDAAAGINEYIVSFFTLDPPTGLYRRHDETHIQKCYSVAEVRDTLGLAGFELLEIADFYRFSPPLPDSEKLLFTAKG